MKPYDPQNLHQRVLDDLGDALKYVGAIVVWNHTRAADLGESYFGQVGRDRCGLVRWLAIDSDFLKARAAFKAMGVDVSLEKNDDAAGKHIEIVAGKVKLLLAHDVDPEVQVPKSEYGKTLAQSNHLRLFDEPVSDATHYVAVLFHSRSQLGMPPKSLELRLPTADGYAAEHIRLFDKFVALRNAQWISEAVTGLFEVPTTGTEKIAKPMPKLRKREGDRKAEGA